MKEKATWVSLRVWVWIRRGASGPGFSEPTEGARGAPGIRMCLAAGLALVPATSLLRIDVVGGKARFPTAPSPTQGPEKGPRGGSASPWPAPLRPTHGVPSPPAAGKAAAGAAAGCGAGGRGRGGAWRRADEMRARPLWAAVLVLGALAGAGVGGE